MANKSRFRTTKTQIKTLCTFFENNPEVIRGYRKTPEGVEAVQIKWKKIAKTLNSLGLQRNYKEWAKYICNMKAKLKRKPIKWKQKSDGTGPMFCNADNFSEIELRMLHVLRTDSSTAGTGQEHDSNSNASNETAMEESSKEESPNEENIIIKEEYQSNIEVVPEHNDSPRPKNPLIWSPNDKDEFDTFGQNVAQQLRTLPLANALETQEMVLSLIRKQRLNVLQRNHSH